MTKKKKKKNTIMRSIKKTKLQHKVSCMMKAYIKTQQKDNVNLHRPC